MKFVQPIRDPKKLDAMKNYLYFKNIRDFIMFLVGINTGFRISDILPLTVRDVKGTHITITEKKTRKVKSVLIRKSLRKALDAYIKDKSDFEYLFPSRKRKRGKTYPITPNMAYKIIRSAAKKLDLEEIGTHSMRKTFGYRLYLETKDIALLMDHFNHSEEKVTLRYVGLLQDTLDDALEDFEL
ncbi:tyrosine-type recombinase/integrase [Paenibacillus graminis]|uniref:Integrase n=1 Tax=Paenibacillus graminis TaxID=189425 RepID=A0A089M989_9BACL|nr:tyrosine-type recombinase/integrase [Paenibacillus graminis]AIQ70371.1 integrase [Paenibacillus graminis]MEC0169734.1 tyrosine-type recombinase/integrase [Paenibacillus graminis]